MTQSITIRGVAHAIQPTSAIALIPLVKAMGADQSRPQSMSDAAYGEMIISRLAEPANHRRIAYSLKAIAPTIPADLLDYRTIEAGGEHLEQFTLNLDIESELVPLVAIALEAWTKGKASPTPAPAARPKPQGFGTAQPPAPILPETLPPAPDPSPALTLEQLRAIVPAETYERILSEANAR